MEVNKQAQLLVWTDVDPDHADDFNTWYDTEHMQERVGIPGFAWGRRYRAVDDHTRRWLAIYRTTNLSVFRSEPYRRVFENQTSWSLKCFSKMRNTVRRVGTVSLELGAGTGGMLVLAPVPPNMTAKIGLTLSGMIGKDGVTCLHAMQSDPELSVALPSSGVSEKPAVKGLQDYVLISVSTPEGARKVAHRIRDYGVLSGPPSIFAFLWELRSGL